MQQSNTLMKVYLLDACSQLDFPVILRGQTWRDSDKGLLTFDTQNMTGYDVKFMGCYEIDKWECYDYDDAVFPTYVIMRYAEKELMPQKFSFID